MGPNEGVTMHRVLDKIKSGTNEARRPEPPRRPTKTADRETQGPPRRCLNEAAHKLPR